jgi:hypothetical protein
MNSAVDILTRRKGHSAEVRFASRAKKLGRCDLQGKQAMRCPAPRWRSACES